MAEFSDKNISEIMEAIEGEPEIEKVPVEPGLTNTTERTDRIVGESTESIIPGENTYYFDVRFYARVKPADDLIECGIKIILDVEAQLEYYVGYDIVTRGVYYASRLISSQYGTEFIGEDFGKLKKVYSIWICMKPPKYGTNSIVNFKLEPDILYGKFPKAKVEEMKYDLIDVVLIFVSTHDDEEKDELCGMLEVLLDKDLGKKEKLDRLENDYDIQKTVELETEVTKMCDYSVGIYRDGIEEGKKKAEKKDRIFWLRQFSYFAKVKMMSRS